MKTCVLIPLLTACTAVSGAVTAVAQDEEPVAAKRQAELVTRFYNISHLVTPQVQFPFQGGLPTGVRSSSGFGGSFAGGLGTGGLGGGGMGGGGGEGFFSVPTATTQMGPMQGGGFGGGGLDLGYGAEAQAAKQLFLQTHDADSIMTLIVEHVAIESWEDYGEEGAGTYRGLGNVLLIRQTEAIHEQIREFLHQLSGAVVGDETLTIEAWWMPLDKVERDDLAQALKKESSAAAADISSITSDAGGFHGEMRCRDRVTANMASGHRMPLVISWIPVVGGDAAADQPIVEHVNVGLFLEITPNIVPDWLQKKEADSGTHVDLGFRSAITSMEPDGKPESTPGEIDRFQMGAHVIEGAAVIPVGKPVVVGTLSSIAIQPKEGNDKNEVVLVLMVMKAAD